MDDKSPMRRPIEWLFRVSLLLLGATIALNLVVVYLQPIAPWLLGAFSLALLVWLTVAIVRWRRSNGD